MIAFSGAKINIGLNIKKKRSDGFHEIESLMYPVPWYDTIEILPSEQFSFETIGHITDYSSNSIIAMISLLEMNQFPIRKEKLKILLFKNIPIGSGLGGASSNAVATLKLLDKKLGLNLNKEQMLSLAGQIGSDCSFFVENNAVLVTGKGEILTETDLSLKGKQLTIIYPDIFVSTQEAFNQIKPNPHHIPVREVIKMPMKDWGKYLVNDFESVLAPQYPEISLIKEKLYSNGAIYASMTGSGSAVYGIFEEKQNLKTVFPNYLIWNGMLD